MNFVWMRFVLALSPFLSSFVRRLNSLFFLFARWLFVMGSTCSSNNTNEQKKNTPKEIIIKIKRMKNLLHRVCKPGKVHSDWNVQVAFVWMNLWAFDLLYRFTHKVNTHNFEMVLLLALLSFWFCCCWSVGWLVFFPSYSYSFNIVQQIIRSYNGMELWLVVYS